MLQDALRYGLLAIYIFILTMLVVYGLHRYYLLFLYYRHRHRAPVPAGRFKTPPLVTVQLPVYNERYVVERIIDSICELDYPADRLEIQVLDDSTDDTQEIAQAAVARHRQAGTNIVYIHRKDRTGFKAGALDAGLRSAAGEFIAIFDADFVPPRTVLRDTMDFFTDPTIGVVQARWGHQNRDNSTLTQSQAIFLDGHFQIEQTARNRSGRFMSFNGTAGLWRRQAILDGGGWEHDTLTEDLDLSYRAQMVGWRCVFLPDVAVPAELPVDMNAFKTQQMRWTKGGIQVARKLIPRVLRADLPWKVKLEAWFHLTASSSYFYMFCLVLLLFPALTIRFDVMLGNLWYSLLDLSLLWIASCSASAFYMASQREIYGHWRDKLKYLPFLMSLGVGMSLCNTVAFFGALFKRKSEFVRTPKFGEASADHVRWKRTAYRGIRSVLPYIEILLGLYFTVVIILAVTRRSIVSMPFLLIFQFGFLYVGLMSLLQRRVGRAPAEVPEPAADQTFAKKTA
jgi:cellulose synthase/poly-beta-1,6-N-acetylglucosamine synthase-like glycosyltransferase